MFLPMPSFPKPTSNASKSSDEASGAAWVTAYQEARLDVPSDTPIHATSLSVLARIVERVVQIEGPIHREEIATRVASLWGLQRTGPRIAEAITRAIEKGIRSGALRAELDFVAHSQQTAVPVRCRSAVAAANVKKPEMIPPSELRQAILHLVTEQLGVRRGEIPLMVARALGFKATSAKLKDGIEKSVDTMIEDNTIVLRDEKLFLP